MGRRLFYPPVFDEDRQLHPMSSLFEKFAFFGGGFEKRHPDLSPQNLCQDKPRKAGTRAEVGHRVGI